VCIDLACVCLSVCTIQSASSWSLMFEVDDDDDDDVLLTCMNRVFSLTSVCRIVVAETSPTFRVFSVCSEHSPRGCHQASCRSELTAHRFLISGIASTEGRANTLCRS